MTLGSPKGRHYPNGVSSTSYAPGEAHLSNILEEHDIIFIIFDSVIVDERYCFMGTGDS
jgi:hypothetical protein